MRKQSFDVASAPYEAPLCEIFDVHSEGVICGSGYGDPGAPAQPLNPLDFGTF